MRYNFNYFFPHTVCHSHTITLCVAGRGDSVDEALATYGTRAKQRMAHGPSVARGTIFNGTLSDLK